MAKKVLDQYANVAAIDLIESAANTLTVAKFAFPFSIMDKMALLLSRIEYEFANLNTVFAATADQMMAGVATQDNVDLTSPTASSLVDVMKLTRTDFGAAATGILTVQPLIKDFSNLPGGGLLVAPNPLYGAIMGVSAAAAGRVKIRMFYTYLELATDEYWQLVESRRIIST